MIKSNYKRLGEYIQEVNIRNTGGIQDNLLGLSTQKIFIKSIANTVGTDFTTYKEIKRNQFAYVSDTSRRGDKIAISLLENYDEAIISQAYTVFEVTDTNELLPEYLMMWFRRPEFDRYARYFSYGSVREIFSWDDMCDIKLPIPSIDKQKEIVAEYNIIQNRITLNNQLIQKLEETAQTIYKQWFVDFEFPDENGKPYKSNGGEMRESEMGEVPKGWRIEKLRKVCDCNISSLSSKDIFEAIEYLDTSNITNNEIGEIQILDLQKDEIPSRAKRKVNHNDIIFSTVRPNLRHFGILKDPKSNMVVSTGFAVLTPTYPNLCSELIYFFVTNDVNLQNLQAIAEMSVSTYPSITSENLMNLDIILPTSDILKKTSPLFDSAFNTMDKMKRENQQLGKLKELLLAKIAKNE